MPKSEPLLISDLLTPVLAGMTLRATGFIVTVYGDAVAPRGGEAWIGAIIETCAAVGISETLVRTAVSRLVAHGQLEGRRQGRLSFYRLTAQAQADFTIAAQRIYGPPEPWQWRFVWLPDDQAETLMPQLERQGFARLRPQLAVGPDRGGLPDGIVTFDAQTTSADGLVGEFVKQSWDLSCHRAAYDAFIGRFGPLEAHASALKGAEALALRLLLVHAWRGALLHDPRLPAHALPADWPGHAARALFVRLYRALFVASDSYLEDVIGPHPEMTDETPRQMPPVSAKPPLAGELPSADSEKITQVQDLRPRSEWLEGLSRNITVS